MHTERNKKSVIGQSYLFFCLIASLAGAGGFLALYLKQGDLLNVDGIYTSVLFQEGVPLTLFTVLFSAAVLIFLSALLFLKPCSSPRRSDPNTYGRVFAQSACGIGLLSLLVMQFLMSKQKISVTPYDLSASTGKLQWVALGCALISALYFLVPLFTDRFKGSARILVGIFIPVWCCLQLLLNHFFSLDPLSSPTKISNVCSLCALALFFLSELRMEFPERAVSKAYAAMGMIAFFCTFTECVPKLILTFGGKCGFSLGLTSFYTIVKLFLGIYALISAYPALVSDKECTEAESLGKPVQKELSENAESAPLPEKASEPAEASQEDSGNSDSLTSENPDSRTDEDHPEETEESSPAPEPVPSDLSEDFSEENAVSQEQEG